MSRPTLTQMAAMCLLLTSNAQADLQGMEEKSLEWLVDSSDAIVVGSRVLKGHTLLHEGVQASTIHSPDAVRFLRKMRDGSVTFHAINLTTGAITRLANYPEAGLATGTAATIGDRLYVFGGARWDQAKSTVVNHSAAHVYSTTTKTWTALPPLPHPGRGITAVTLDARHILVAGGYRNDDVEFVRDAYVYDVQTGIYTATTPLPYAAMVALVQSGDWLYCLGGEDRKKHRTDAAYRIRWRELLRRQS